MSSFTARVVSVFFLLLAAVNAFAPMPSTTSTNAIRRSSPIVSMTPIDAAPAALDLVSQLPTQLVSLEVTTAAFLAVLLGTFFPVFFLITLYIQSEGYKAGNPEEF